MYTKREAAEKLGIDRKTLDKWLKALELEPARDGRDGRLRVLSEEDVRTIRERYADRHTFSVSFAHRPQTVPVSSADLAARVAALEATIEQLREHSPWLFRERSAGTLATGEELSAYEPPRRPSASTVRYRPSSGDGSFPSSVRGRARWVEEHGGPGSSWVRTWVDVASWRSPEDAIASVRRHQRWHDWSPVGLVSEEDNETPHIAPEM